MPAWLSRPSAEIKQESRARMPLRVGHQQPLVRVDRAALATRAPTIRDNRDPIGDRNVRNPGPHTDQSSAPHADDLHRRARSGAPRDNVLAQPRWAERGIRRSAGAMHSHMQPAADRRSAPRPADWHSNRVEGVGLAPEAAALRESQPPSPGPLPRYPNRLLRLSPR